MNDFLNKLSFSISAAEIAIIKLREDMDALKADNDELKTDNISLKKDIERLQNRLWCLEREAGYSGED